MNPIMVWIWGVACGVAAVEITEQILGVLVASVVASVMRGVAQ